MPVHVLRVTGGQDHGARFGLRGRSVVLGRDPEADAVLTDPTVAPLHARVSVRGDALEVEDLGSGAGTLVNGARLSGPAALAPGDRVAMGRTELTVLWTPTGSLAPPPPPPPPSAPTAPPAIPAAPAEPLARASVLLPIAGLALSAFALVATWMPALGDPAGTDSIWTLEPAGLRVQALAAALLTAAAAAGWLAAAAASAGRGARALLAGATALGGGLIAGLPLFLAAADLAGAAVEPGLVLLALAGAAVCGCAVAGVREVAAGAGPAAASPGGAALLAAGGGVGGALALAGVPLTWVATPLADLSGLDEGVRAGGWLVPLALAIVALSALTLAVSRAGAPAAAATLAAAAAALAGAGLAYVNGAALGFADLVTGSGLGLALSGTAIAATTVAIGGGAMAVRLAAPTGP